MYKACSENERKQPDWLVLASLDIDTSGTYRRSDARQTETPCMNLTYYSSYDELSVRVLEQAIPVCIPHIPSVCLLRSSSGFLK